jgi:oxalate decarboxylase
MTVYASGSDAQTFDYQGGDVGYVPKSMPHYVENTGATRLRYLELWQSDHFADVSLAQWLAFTPYELVKAHLCPDNGDCMLNWVSPAEGWKSPQHPLGESYEHRNTQRNRNAPVSDGSR